MDLDNKNLIAWLPFNTSPTADVKGNTWQTYGNPTIGKTNAINGNALQLDGQSYIKLSNVMLGGQDFYIDGYIYVDSSSPNYACVLNIVNPDTGYPLVIVHKSPTDATKFDFWVNAYEDVTQDGGYNYTSSINSVGERVHFKLIYRYTDRRISFCINDVIAADVTPTSRVQRFTRRAFDIYIGANVNAKLYMIGSIDELRIYDGTWFSYNNGTPPTVDEYRSITQSFDVAGKITNPLTTWRYDNRGDADDLILTAPILTNLPAIMSKTGTAFYQTTRAKCFNLPATTDIWIKFDVYFDGANRWRAYNAVSSGNTNGVTAQTDGGLSFFSTDIGTTTNLHFVDVCKTNQLQTVLLHMQTGTTDGFVEAWVDGDFIHCYTGNVNSGAAFEDIYLQSDGEGTFFSNVIISNGEIGLNEDAAQTLCFDVERLISTYIYFKPEMYISFISSREGYDYGDNIYFKPEMAISFIPAVIDVDETYDVLRVVTQPVEVSEIFDTERRLANEVQITADVKRTVLNGVTLIADMERNVANVYENRFDVERRTANRVEIFFDVERIALNSIDFIADVERKILSATTGQRMLSRISPIYDESTFMKCFFRAIGAEWEKIRRYFLTLREQRFIHTVDWGIEYLEHKYSVVPDRTLTLEERRARLGLKSFKKYPLNPAVLEKFARDNFDLEVYLDESDAGYIWMFITNFTKAGFKGYMKHLLREKPAHLALAVLLYMTLYIGRERDDDLPKLYAGIVELLTGNGTITLPKPKSQRLTIYAGVAQVWRGSITLRTKTNPYPRLPNQRLNIFAGVAQYWRGSVTIGSKTKPYEHTY